MPKGKSLHIGLNSVDPGSYDGWSGPLTACEADAKDMSAIASAAGFSTQKLLTREATRDAVKKAIKAAADELGPGDMFLLTNSSHGGQVPDRNNDEDDGRDETWCLYDGQLIDDELYELWSAFKPNTRIFVLSDSCHSGTSVRDAVLSAGAAATGTGDVIGPQAVPRCLPPELVGRAYRAKKELYDSLQAPKPKRENDVQAAVLLISGCQDPQTSMDGPFNGAFTGALLRVWNDGAFKGSYRSFHRKIQRLLPLTQQPNLMTFGRGESFASKRPFSI